MFFCFIFSLYIIPYILICCKIKGTEPPNNHCSAICHSLRGWLHIIVQKKDKGGSILMKIENAFRSNCGSERLAHIQEIHRRSLAELRQHHRDFFPPTTNLKVW